MREILFRGKRIKDGVWVSGYLYTEHGFINNGKTYILSSLYANFFNEVDPETVGQYTGFCDKFGIDAYEDDVVRTDSGLRMQITMLNGFWQLLSPSGAFSAVWSNMDDAEIIGNVHDNPELLGGDKDD